MIAGKNANARRTLHGSSPRCAATNGRAAARKIVTFSRLSLDGEIIV